MFLQDKVKKDIVEFINKELNIKIIYLFGSFAKGEGRQDSDIDLAIYSTSNIDEYELFILAGNLSFKVKRDVQIINIKNASTVFAAQIVGLGEVLYCDDEEFRANYEIRIFKDYAKLNEERAAILEVIERDGKVYGEGCNIQ